jgi:hypothetical protein
VASLCQVSSPARKSGLFQPQRTGKMPVLLPTQKFNPKLKIESPIISFNKKVESSFKPFTYQPEEIDLAKT